MEDLETVSVKKYAVGPAYFCTKGPAAFKDQVAEILKASWVCSVTSFVRKDVFMKVMKEAKIPDEAIATFMQNLWVDDDHCMLRDNPEW